MNDINLTIKIDQDSDPQLVALIMSLLAAVQSNPEAITIESIVATEYLTRDDFQNYVLDAEYEARDVESIQRAKTKVTRAWSELIMAYRRGQIVHDLHLRCSTCLLDVDHCPHQFMFSSSSQHRTSDRGLQYVNTAANWQISKEAILDLNEGELQSIHVAHRRRWMSYVEHLKSQG